VLKARHIQIIIIILLIVGLAFTSTAAVAYWHDVNTTSNVIIEFGGEQASLEITETGTSFTGTLVPEGHAFFLGEKEEATFVYTVSIDKTLVKSVNLIVEAIEVKIGDSTEYAHLVDIQINGTKDEHTNELFNSEVVITVVIKLIEPLDESEVEDPLLANVEDSVAAYNAIRGQDLSFTLSFTVEPKESEE
jgi:predicted ribosomally synthesized peptide with SipW-like signal peptide